MKKLVLASNNKAKLKEIREILNDKFEVLSLADCGVKVEVEETGVTFEENALIKAKAIYELVKMPIISDDSGLIVNALGGAPGVYSARFAGEKATDEQNNAKLLVELQGKNDRSAAFICCAVYYDGKNTVSVNGRVDGVILHEKEGENGFGYDPLFFCTELNKSFGIAGDEEKNAVSHRARAFELLAEKI